MNKDDKIVEKLKESDLASISRLMTWAESNKKSNQKKALEILKKIKSKNNKSIRIGISGAPGVGKSTFIESLGLKLANQGKKIAVFAIDPSSPISKGSILGDKTRMEDLAKHPNVFIRPSPSSGELGGLARRTRTLIEIAEAANYDIIILETVGVGQSEIDVKYLTDLFLLLILPGGGDDLQGIKKGAVELADMIVINKADGDNAVLANHTMSDYLHAMKILGGKSKDDLLKCSSINGEGIQEIWDRVFLRIEESKKSNEFSKRRNSNNLFWFEKELKDEIINNYFSDPDNSSNYDIIKNKLASEEINISEAILAMNLKEF